VNLQPDSDRLLAGMNEYRGATVPVILVAIIALGLYVFVEISDEVLEDELRDIDSWLLLFFRDPADLSVAIGPPWLAESVAEITALGGYTLIIILIAAVVGFLLIAGRYGPALYVLLSVSLGTLVSHFLKLAYERPRPDIVEHLVTTHTASFPSGHATMSAVVYLTLAALVMRMVDSVTLRIYVLAVAIALTVLIGMSRIYLGVHWPSDVIAGWALGAAWASLAWLAVTAIRWWRHRGKAQSEVSGRA
jgi:undecaprenyl-diphosphatase